MKSAGPTAQKETEAFVEKRGKVPVGQAVIATGGALNSKYLIHIVLP